MRGIGKKIVHKSMELIDKIQHWSGVSAILCLQASPVLEFQYLRVPTTVNNLTPLSPFYNRSSGLITPPPPTFSTCV